MSSEPRAIRVCVVSPLYHPSLGGLGRQAQLLTERLAEEGVEVFVIARKMKGMPRAAFSEKVKVYRAWSIKPCLHTYEKVTLLNILISLTFSLSCAFLLLQKRKEYEIVHFHGASLPLFFNLPLLKLLRKKVMAKVAAAGVGTEAGSLRGRHLGLGNVFIRLLKMVDAFIATTAEIEEGLRRDGFDRKKIRRIPNFIDLPVFSGASGEAKTEIKARMGCENRYIVTFSGRFIPRKGVSFLLEAWRNVINEEPAARLLLLGDGPLLGDMKKRAAGLGIEDSVDFRGHVNSVMDYFQMTDIFVLPSLQEGMPNALLEAMAFGLPAVATKIGGVVDIIRDGENGLLVNPGDPAGMSAAILRLLGDPVLARRISTSALETIKSSYSLDCVAPRYIEIYRALAS